MRTLNIPDDVYKVARSLAAARRISLGEALAELARQGLHWATRVGTCGVPLFRRAGAGEAHYSGADAGRRR